MVIHSHRTFRTRLVAGLLAVGMAAASCSSGEDAAAEGGAESAAELELYDSSAVHEITVSFDEDDYDAMVETFADTSEKEWIEATVTIDGVTYEQVGLRLKGNSSLAGLGGGFGGPRPGAAEGGSADTTTTETVDESDAAESEDESTTSEDDEAPDGERPEGFGGSDGPGGSASADEPERLPWLIRLDKFVDDQNHQGHEEIVVRSNNSATSLNEAVVLELLEEAGLASQQASATRFSVNGSDAALRLTIEHPDEVWNEAIFDTDGALYKAKSSGDWSYRGDDPEAYDEDVFEQKAGDDVADLTPLIEFLDFINNADDETFAAELPERLDVESFATYLAMMDLIGNFDDIDGPGNNAYLHYDPESDTFTVVPWDMNLAFGVGFGDGGFPGGADGGGPPEDFELPEGSEPPEDFEIPDGGGPPEGLELPEGSEPPEDLESPDGGGAGFGGRSNPLVEPFHDTPELEALYQEQLTELRASLYESGTADDVLAEWVAVLSEQATDLVDEATITEEADAIAEQFTTE